VLKQEKGTKIPRDNRHEARFITHCLCRRHICRGPNHCYGNHISKHRLQIAICAGTITDLSRLVLLCRTVVTQKERQGQLKSKYAVWKRLHQSAASFACLEALKDRTTRPTTSVLIMLRQGGSKGEEEGGPRSSKQRRLAQLRWASDGLFSQMIYGRTFFTPSRRRP